MREIDIPMFLVFMAITLVSALIAYYCWRVIQKYRARLARRDQSRASRAADALIMTAMFIPLVGFLFEVLYFLYQMGMEVSLLLSPR